MIESITDRQCYKNWYITDKSYESISDVIKIGISPINHTSLSVIQVYQ